MRFFIVHAHHEPRSFNRALTDAAIETLSGLGHEVVVSDLYAMGFDPVSDRRNFTGAADASYLKQQREETHATETGGFAPDVLAEIEKLEACDALIFQCPMWWFGMPAILKGWCDRVLAAGRVYGGGKWYDDGLKKGARAMLSITTGGPPTMYGPDGINGDIDTVLYPINHGVFRFIGFDVLPQHVVWGPARMTDDGRAQAIEGYRERLRAFHETEPIAYPPLSDFDSKTYTRKA
ncbi:MAG: NAD(P)H-dependent oxidoreductase [Planctomycetota bacterium]